MKKITKFLSVVMAVVMLLCATPITNLESPWSIDANAGWGTGDRPPVEEFEEGIYTYTVENGEAKIIDCDYSAKGKIVIPSTLGGYPVTEIWMDAFYSCDLITSVIIPEGVIRIEGYAFGHCPNLVSVTIPKSVNEISYSSFIECPKMEEIIVDKNNPCYTTDKYGVLYTKDMETLICCPATKKITKYVIPDSVVNIEYGAFWGCINISDFEIPDSVNNISHYAFQNTGYYNNSANWENDVLYIDNYLIEAKDTLSGKYNIKLETKKIATFAFEDCPNLISVAIPNSVTTINTQAFFCLENLTSVTIGSGVTYIEEFGFAMCENLTDVYYAGTEEEWNKISIGSYNECLLNSTIHFKEEEEEITQNIFTYEIENGEVTITGCDESASGAIVIPSTIEGYPVTTIDVKAFEDNANISSISIPETVRDLSSTSFGKLTGLTSINVNPNNSYYSSNDGILYNKNQTELIKYPAGKAYTEFTIPYFVTDIGYVAFECCYNLTSVKIPAHVTHIDICPFWDCANLKSIIVDEDNLNYSSDNNGVLFNKSKTTLIQYPAGSPTEHYTIPDGVTWIPYAAFINSQNLVSVTMPDTVTTLGEQLFQTCEKLTSVSLSENIETIPQVAFYRCTNLTSIDIPDSVTTIEFEAFYDCNNLTSVKLGNNIANIDEEAFDWCTSLTDVYFDGTKAEWNAISIGEGNEYLTGATIHFGAEPTPAPLTKLSFEQDNYTVNYKGSLKVVATPNIETDQEINYITNNSTVVTIDDKGNITTIGPGTATVIATIDGTVISDTCTVTVSYTWWQWIIVVVLFGWIWY